MVVVQNQAIVQPSRLYFKVHYDIQEGSMMQISYKEYITLYTIETKIFQ